MARPFDLMALVGPRPRLLGTDYAVVPDRGVVGMVEAMPGSANLMLSDECALLAAEEIRRNVSDDPDDLAATIARYERPLGPRYSPARLTASIQVAADKIRQMVADQRMIVRLSIAGWILDAEGLFLAWSGSTVAAHRIRGSSVERLTPDQPADRAVPWGAPHQARTTVAAGDLIVMSRTWWPGLRSRGEDLLEFLAARGLEPAALAAMHDLDWRDVLPAVVARCNADLG